MVVDTPAVRHVAELRRRIQELSRDLYLERERRQAAERQANRFHALLLEERIKHLEPGRTT